MINKNESVDAITIIKRLIPTLTYLELTALGSAIDSRRYNMRQSEIKNFKEIEFVDYTNEKAIK